MEPNLIYIGIKHYEPSQGASLVAGISKIHKACQKTRPQRSLSMKNPLLLTLKENACNYLMMADQEERPRMVSDETSFGSLRRSKKKKDNTKKPFLLLRFIFTFQQVMLLLHNTLTLTQLRLSWYVSVTSKL